MNRRALLFGGIAALLILLLWYFMLWSPRNSDLSEAKARTEAATLRIADLNLQLERLKKAQAEQPIKLARLSGLRAAIPDNPQLAEFILDTNSAANSSGIDFLSVAPSPPAPPAPGSAPGTPSQINIGLSVTGGYFQVLDFMNRLEAMPRIVVVDTLNLSGNPVISAQITARMFVSGLPPEALTPAPTVPTTSTTISTGAPTTATSAPTNATPASTGGQP
ncbi:MAG TPA: type 4a pilus biogenesis protein PilO [Acidimicrobiales bacterium]|nr:type 4a pilus biogenesis protein PilO [Acidimicrobiales bacterium]